MYKLADLGLFVNWNSKAQLMDSAHSLSSKTQLMVLAYASLLWIRGIRNITFSTQFLLFIKSRWYSLFTTRYSRFTTRDSLLTTRYSLFTTKLFHDPSPRTNVAGRNDRTHDRPHSRWTRIRLSYCARGCTLMHHMLGKKSPLLFEDIPLVTFVYFKNKRLSHIWHSILYK